jgi:ribonuclease P protein component
MQRLRKRQDFVRIGKTGRRAGSRFFSLQIAAISPQLRSISASRIGFTVTKKVGNAVQRNRARRRMRVLANSVLPEYVLRDVDCVLLARRPILDAKFDQLARELRNLLGKLRIEIRSTSIG